jgi:hypothetical protein
MLRRLRAWLSGAPPAPPARLSPAEALAIAREAVDPGEAAMLVPVREDAVAQDGVWHFWTPTIGSQRLVSVDDATGRVLRAERVGLR